MATLSAFIFTTLNGYTHDPNGDISWHVHGEEENEYAAQGLSSGNTLVFGRKTYEMMASYWPTPMAMNNDPEVAEGMNSAAKIVFSNTLSKADWQNTEVIGGDIIEAMKKLKKSSTANFTLLGSNSIVSQLASHGLIDELQLMIDPVAIGNGVSLFKGINHPVSFSLKNVHAMKSGVLLLNYTLHKQHT